MEKIKPNGAVDVGLAEGSFLNSPDSVGQNRMEDDKDKGLGSSLPTTTSPSQVSLSLVNESRLSHLQLNTLVKFTAPVHASIKH